MKISVQTDNLDALKEAVKSSCESVRFGPEFCEWKLPSLDELKKAYTLVKTEGKDFTYVTPRVSPQGLDTIQEHLNFIKQQEPVGVIINDLGVLNIVNNTSTLEPHLGRQLVYVPARTPWKEITNHPVGFLEKRRIKKLFHQTSLNYEPTIRFFQGLGVQHVDVDWIPGCLPHLKHLIRNGFTLSVYLHLVPVAIARRCHTARFLGEPTIENCSRPCDTQAFMIHQKELGLELFLYGNAVYRLIPASRRDITKLYKSKVDEFVIAINPLTTGKTRDPLEAITKILKPIRNTHS